MEINIIDTRNEVVEMVDALNQDKERVMQERQAKAEEIARQSHKIAQMEERVAGEGKVCEKIF